MCVLIGLCYAMITFLTPKGQSVNIQFIMLSMLSLYTLNTLIHWLKTSLYIYTYLCTYMDLQTFINVFIFITSGLRIKWFVDREFLKINFWKIFYSFP